MRLSVGSMFAFAAGDGPPCIGRILLDIQSQAVEPGLIAPDSVLWYFGECLLVELFPYGTTMDTVGHKEPLVRGLFTDRIDAEQGLWEELEKREVSERDVDFPEFVVGNRGAEIYNRGEVEIPIPLTTAQSVEINVFPAIVASSILTPLVLGMSGRDELIEPRFRGAGYTSLMTRDLRFSRHRARVLKLLPVSVDIPYWRLALQFSFDTARFFRRARS